MTAIFWTMMRVMMCSMFAFALAFGPSMANAGELKRVNCNDGDLLQEEIDEVDIAATILVTGTCTENVVIRTDRLRILAIGDATIDGSGDTTTGAVRILSRNVTIRGFTIIAGQNGIMVLSGGSAVIESNDILGAPVNGVLVTQASYARVGGTSLARGNEIKGNKFGVKVRNGAAADIFFNTITGDNDTTTNDHGISVNSNGAVDMSDNVISEFERGLSVASGANALMSTSLATTGGANTFTNNNVAIFCRLGGSVSAGRPTVAQIKGGGNGTLVDAFFSFVGGPASCNVDTEITFVDPPP